MPLSLYLILRTGGVRHRRKKRVPNRVLFSGTGDRTLHGRTQYATGILLPKMLRRRLAFLEPDFESVLLLMPKQSTTRWVVLCFGAGDRTRTGTLSPAVDFESTTSTNSITPAGGLCYYTAVI